MNLQQALDRLNQSRQALYQAIQGLGEDDLNQTQVEGTWSIRDLIGHITAWEKTLLEPLESLAQGGAFQPEIVGDHDAWNAAQAAKRKEWSTAKLLQEMDETHAGLISFSKWLTDEQLAQNFQAPWGGQEPIPGQISGLAWHTEEHLKSIHKYIAKK